MESKELQELKRAGYLFAHPVSTPILLFAWLYQHMLVWGI